jgi:predicted RNase H-like HicB family nuclease
MFKVEFEEDSDGRWIAEIPSLPGVMSYGATREDALRRATTLLLEVLAGQVRRGRDPLSVGIVAV